MTLGGPRSVQPNDRQTVQSVLGDLGNTLLREVVRFLNNGWVLDSIHISTGEYSWLQE